MRERGKGLGIGAGEMLLVLSLEKEGFEVEGAPHLPPFSCPALQLQSRAPQSPREGFWGAKAGAPCSAAGTPSTSRCSSLLHVPDWLEKKENVYSDIS